MSKVQRSLDILEKLSQNPDKYNLDINDLYSIRELDILLKRLYRVQTRGNHGPRIKLKVTKEQMKRVAGEPLNRIILYLFQENREPVCFNSLVEFIRTAELSNSNYLRQIINLSLSVLVKDGYITKLSRGMYDITEKGKAVIV